MFTTHYRKYTITELTPGRILVTLPNRVYPLAGLELKTVEEAKSWIDEDIFDSNEQARLEQRYEASEGE